VSKTDPTTRELSGQIEELKTALGTALGVVPATATDTVTEPAPVAPGDIIHILQPVALFGDVQERGRELTVTQQFIDGTTDRNGRSALQDLIEKGVVGLGAWPEGLRKWQVKEDRQWGYEYLRALDEVRKIVDPFERSQAEAAMLREYGAPSKEWADRNIGVTGPKRSKWSY
jgi:hypothetical protein